MANELEALVAHLYIVGKRAVGTAPPGALAAPAPKRVPRIRQEETLFVLIVPSGAAKATANIYQSLAENAVEHYFQTTGSMTNGLRETLLDLHDHIKNHQQAMGQPFYASALIAVMRDQEVYLGRCGPMVAFFRDADQFSSFPSDRSADHLALFTPLGEGELPRIELNRYELTPGSVLVMMDQPMADTANQQIKQALTGDIHEVLEPLRLLMDTGLAHATIVQFVTEDAPTPPPPDLRATVPQPQPQKVSDLPAVIPMASPPVPVPDEVEVQVSEPQPSLFQRGASGIAGLLMGIAGGINALGERIFPPEDAEGNRSIPWLSNLVVLLGMMIPLVVVVVVVSLVLSQTGTTDFEVCRVEVLAHRDEINNLRPQNIDPQDIEGAAAARAAWELVQEEALLCERNKPGDEEMRRIAGEAQNVIDAFDRITRREIQVMRQFEPNADLRGPISGNWIQIYTLDRRYDTVFQDVLRDDGLGLVAVGDDPIIFEGQSVGGYIVGDLVDLVWAERSGIPDGQNNVPIILDRNGLLISYSEAFERYDTHLLQHVPNWNPVAIETFRLNLYVLDTASQQIWRYVPTRGAYYDPPEEYFTGGNRPDLSNAVDFGIDSEGYVYILFADGALRKYQAGTEMPSFNIYNLPDGALNAASSLYVDNHPQTRGLIVTDPVSGTVYTMSWGGTVYNGFRPVNGLDAFKDASGTLMNGDRNIMYVLADNFMYSFQPILTGQ